MHCLPRAHHLRWCWRTMLGYRRTSQISCTEMIAVLPKHWDLVHLYDRDEYPARPLGAVGTEHELVRYSRVPGGCVAYLISRSGARKLRRRELRSWPLDTDFRRPWHFDLDSYGIRPALIDHDNDFTSAILKRGPRSRRRRGITLSSPLHSLQGRALEPAQARNWLVAVLSCDQQWAASGESGRQPADATGSTSLIKRGSSRC